MSKGNYERFIFLKEEASMTTRLELERVALNRGKEEKSRETLLVLEDRWGMHQTEFGDVEIDIKITPVNHDRYIGGHRRRSGYYGRIYYKEPPYNTDVIIEAKDAPHLAQILKAPKRRVSVGTDGNGTQQIGKGVTLFVHSDSFRRERK